MTRDAKLYAIGACLLLFLLNIYVGYQENYSKGDVDSTPKILIKSKHTEDKTPIPRATDDEDKKHTPKTHHKDKKKKLKPKDKHKKEVKIINTAFTDPDLAASIITILDPQYEEKKYCREVLKHITTRSIKEIYKMKFYTNYTPVYLNLFNGMKEQGGIMVETRKHDYNAKVRVFFTHNSHDNEKQSESCPHQSTSHIIGNSQLGSKDTVAEAHQIYRTRFEEKSHCLNDFMPYTYILEDKKQCQNFFTYLNSKEYEETRLKQHIVFMEKLASGKEAHSANGVKPFDVHREERMKKSYDNGAKCGQVMDNTIMQYYISNPLLIEGHKFDMRVHLFIASINPLIAYYQDGCFRVSLQKFNASSDDPNIHLSNKDDEKPKDMSKKEKSRLLNLNMDDLVNDLIKDGLVKDKTWVDTVLRNRIQKSIVHLVNAGKPHFSKTTNSFETMGCDFLLDTNFNIWFMECQSDPNYTNAESRSLARSQFEIVVGLLKSRLKRLVAFVNEITEHAKGRSGKELKKYLKGRQEEYNKISMNYFEEEFLPKKTNTLVKIMDENLDGKERYGNLFPSDCVDVLSK